MPFTPVVPQVAPGPAPPQPKHLFTVKPGGIAGYLGKPLSLTLTLMIS